MDDPAELIHDRNPPGASQAYVETCEGVGVSRFLTTHRDEGEFAVIDEEQIVAGPPK